MDVFGVGLDPGGLSSGEPSEARHPQNQTWEAMHPIPGILSALVQTILLCRCRSDCAWPPGQGVCSKARAVSPNEIFPNIVILHVWFSQIISLLFLASLTESSPCVFGMHLPSELTACGCSSPVPSPTTLSMVSSGRASETTCSVTVAHLLVRARANPIRK